MYDENEDISYSWVREYHYDVCSCNIEYTFLVCLLQQLLILCPLNDFTGAR